MEHQKSKIKRLLKIKKFLVDELWQHVLIICVIGLCAYLFNKPLEALMFCAAHWQIRTQCDKQFHCKNTFNCLAMTFTVISLATLTVLPLSISLLSAVPLAYFVVYFGYLLQSKIDQQTTIKQLKEYIDELLAQINSPKDIYAMDEDELYAHCRAKGLDDVDCKIAEMIVIQRLKGQALYDAIGYSERQTKRKRSKILNTIK